MSSSSEQLLRGRVVSGATVTAAPADLGVVASRAASNIVVSPELIEAATRDGFAEGHAEG